MPTPDTTTASVSDPTPIPERPEMRGIVHLVEIAGEMQWHATTPRSIGSPDDFHDWQKRLLHPGSITFTIPGSTPQPAQTGEAPPDAQTPQRAESNHTPAQPGEECAGCGVCQPTPPSPASGGDKERSEVLGPLNDLLTECGVDLCSINTYADAFRDLLAEKDREIERAGVRYGELLAIKEDLERACSDLRKSGPF